MQGSLRPVMKSFILALLPGLEEETGEFFDQVLNLLDRLSTAVSLSFFLENVWLILLTMPPVRGTALNLVSRRLPKLVAENGTSLGELDPQADDPDRFHHNAWSRCRSHDPCFRCCSGG
jgi:Dopey, N-terminal